jgi:hypothetical protein
VGVSKIYFVQLSSNDFDYLPYEIIGLNLTSLIVSRLPSSLLFPFPLFHPLLPLPSHLHCFSLTLPLLMLVLLSLLLLPVFSRLSQPSLLSFSSLSAHVSFSPPSSPLNGS